MGNDWANAYSNLRRLERGEPMKDYAKEHTDAIALPRRITEPAQWVRNIAILIEQGKTTIQHKHDNRMLIILPDGNGEFYLWKDEGDPQEPLNYGNGWKTEGIPTVSCEATLLGEHYESLQRYLKAKTFSDKRDEWANKC